MPAVDLPKASSSLESSVSYSPLDQWSTESGNASAPERGAAAPGAAALLHQEENVSIKEYPSGFSSYGKRRKLRLQVAIEWMIQKHGYEKMGFLTITFRENLTDWAEAEKRFKSFEQNVLSLHCKDWAMVVQLQKRGAVHYHLVCALPKDIRTGTDIQHVKNRSLPRWLRYGKKYVSPHLRRYWGEICFRARGEREWEGGGYGIGRIELMPLEKEGGAVANYLANYLKIDAYCPEEYRKKKKLRFSKTISCWLSSSFQANTFGNYLWRKKLSLVARDFGMSSYEDLSDYFGPRWFWILRDAIRLCPFEMDKNDWKKGIAEKLFQVHFIETFDMCAGLGVRSNAKKWVDYAAAKKEAWRLFEESLKPVEAASDGDPDWSVDVFEPPAEWQAQFALMSREVGNV